MNKFYLNNSNNFKRRKKDNNNLQKKTMKIKTSNKLQRIIMKIFITTIIINKNIRKTLEKEYQLLKIKNL